MNPKSFAEHQNEESDVTLSISHPICPFPGYYEKSQKVLTKMLLKGK